MPRESDPERLQRRIANALYNEQQIQARREAEAAGSRQWVEQHARRAGHPTRRDSGPIRTNTVSDYPVF